MWGVRYIFLDGTRSAEPYWAGMGHDGDPNWPWTDKKEKAIKFDNLKEAKRIATQYNTVILKARRARVFRIKEKG